VAGTSTVTTYVESAAGIAEGGKTGATALVTGILFLLSLFSLALGRSSAFCSYGASSHCGGFSHDGAHFEN